MLSRAISEAVNKESVYDEHLISATAAGYMRLSLVCGIVAPWKGSDDGPDTRGRYSLDIIAGRGDVVVLRLDHIMKSEDQPPVRRERGELRRIRRTYPR